MSRNSGWRNARMKKIEDYVRNIPDFPEPGIIFRDVTSILQDADGLHLAIDSMQDCISGLDFDIVAGTESRVLSLECRLRIICINRSFRSGKRESSHVKQLSRAMTWSMEAQ